MGSNERFLLEISALEKENPAVFALKWSGVGTAIALCLVMASCESFLPKETPRYNIVVGERRAPELNAQMLGGVPAQQAAPVPLVAQDGTYTPPVPMANDATAMQSAPLPLNTGMEDQDPMLMSPPQNAAPMQQAMQPEPINPQMAQAPAPESPSMLNQLTGAFSSDPQPQAYAAPQPYPVLPPTQQQPMQQAQPPAATSMEAEMAALERDLYNAQQQQQQLQPQQPQMAPIPDFTQQPLPEAAFAPAPPPMPTAPMPTAPAPIAAPQPPMPAALPPQQGFIMQPIDQIAPEPPQAVAPQPMQQPLPVASAPRLLPPPPPAPAAMQAPAYAAPSYAPSEQPAYAAAPISEPAPQYTIVPPAPTVYGNAAPLGASAGLTPPANDYGAYGDGYLPAARYTGRKLRSY